MVLLFVRPLRSGSNMMVDRVSGKVVHIDFGDCFEVAMQRDKFPEKVPFRLTRMLVNAMEVGGMWLLCGCCCCCYTGWGWFNSRYRLISCSILADL